MGLISPGGGLPLDGQDASQNTDYCLRTFPVPREPHCAGGSVGAAAGGGERGAARGRQSETRDTALPAPEAPEFCLAAVGLKASFSKCSASHLRHLKQNLFWLVLVHVKRGERLCRLVLWPLRIRIQSPRGDCKANCRLDCRISGFQQLRPTQIVGSLGPSVECGYI